MKEKTEKIVVLSAVATTSLLTIFCLTKVAMSPNDLFSPLDFTRNLFVQNHELETEERPKLPVIEPKPITLIFGGDVMLSRHVNDKMVQNNNYSWPFINIAEYLNAADLTVINLESPFAEAKNYSVPTGSFTFKANPKALAGLLISGVDLVSLANNHILNQGATGLEKTLEILSTNNVKSVGAGKNETAARRPEIFNLQNKKFGFLAYAYPNDNSVAAENRPGVANMNSAKMTEDVSELKKNVDFLTVIIHAGEEYTTKPNKQQISFAHQAIESGADLVIGHHPHWPQTMEFYQGKPIIYSLGNLIFDQMFSEETKTGLLAKINWENGLRNIELIPIKITDYGQANIMADGPEKEALFKKLNLPADGKIEIKE